MENSNFIGIFLTGLLAGGLSCLAVQGGLLAATIAQREEENLKDKTTKTNNLIPLLAFLLAKILAYTLMGGLLGIIGRAATFSIQMQVGLQILVAVFMVGTALALLNVHPIFRYFIIQPPKFLTKKIRSVSKSGDYFAPALLGFLTIFIPCGVTQAAMATAIASANPWTGAAIMFAFTLGTSPLFFILGFFAAHLGNAMHAKFMKIVAVLILLLAGYNMNNAIALTGTPRPLQTIAEKLWCSVTYCGQNSVEAGPAVSEATIKILKDGYSPNVLNVKAGSSVTLRLENADTYGCQLAFTIPKLNIRKIVPPKSSETITFTAPNKPGQLAFMCSMGMYRGVINVN